MGTGDIFTADKGPLRPPLAARRSV